jgi:hypothetical protein
MLFFKSVSSMLFLLVRKSLCQTFVMLTAKAEVPAPFPRFFERDYVRTKQTISLIVSR